MFNLPLYSIGISFISITDEIFVRVLHKPGTQHVKQEFNVGAAGTNRVKVTCETKESKSPSVVISKQRGCRTKLNFKSALNKATSAPP